MLDILLASGNQGKWREFEQILALSGAADVTLRLPDGDAPRVDETGTSYSANARLKARAFSLQYNKPALGDDSGLAVDALGGAPGVYTARFGGEGLTSRQRMDLLLERMRGLPPERRGAHFVCVLCLAFPDGREIMARGLVHGRIADEVRGEGGFGYDPVFLLPRRGVTMAELEPDQKHTLSHRAHAMHRLLAHLRSLGLAG